MIYFIQIIVYLIILLNKSDGINNDILLFNDPSHDHQSSYTIIRSKRDQQSSWLYPEIDKNQISCGHNVYVKVHTCIYLKDCK
jgi:hypothetical protein